jgi:hypothetical protein
MYRSHKRLLKQSKLQKKKNINKERHIYDYYHNGTGTRSISYIYNQKYQKYKHDNGISLLRRIGCPVWCTNAKYNQAMIDDVVPTDDWTDRHPGQIMESDIHDRTRWKSNKTKNMISEKLTNYCNYQFKIAFYGF